VRSTAAVVFLSIVVTAFCSWGTLAQAPAPAPMPPVMEPPPAEPPPPPAVATPDGGDPTGPPGRPPAHPHATSPQPAPPLLPPDGMPGMQGGPTPPDPIAEQQFPPWLRDGLPPNALAFLNNYPPLVTAMSLARMYARLLTFLGLFLLVGLVFRHLAHAAIVPRRPQDTSRSADPEADEEARMRFARWNVVVWAAALIVACESLGLNWFSTLLSSFSNVLEVALSGVFWLAILLLVAYSIASPGRELVLSLIGWGYLKYHPERPKPDQEFDLGDGRLGRVERVDPLQTTFVLTDDERVVRPNAWLMRTYFNWDAPKAADAPKPE